ncbi:MAG: ROK family protein [Syntrophomonadaceae bacterium]
MRELVLGIDLGATKILTGILNKDGRIIGKKRQPTPLGNASEVLDFMVESTLQLMNAYGVLQEEITGIAVASPGPLAFPEGIVIDSPNLSWGRVELKEELARRLGRPVIVENDTNMAVLGEYHYGRSCLSQELIYITISTGIGAGIITAGNLHRGRKGGAGEVGHMVIKAGEEQCQCGKRGCLEALAGGRAIEKRVQEMIKMGRGQGILACTDPGEAAGPRHLGMAARLGDKEAVDLIAQLVEYLGIGIVNLVNILNPEAIILGGGVMLGLKDLLLEPVKKYVWQNALALNREHLVIDCTGLGEDIVLYGCLAVINHGGY